MRLLLDEDWFDAVSSTGQYEHDFESIITSRARLLFPGYHVISFKAPVESDHARRVPDLALIDHGYRAWWVVEVEMAHHSLYGHVLPQVEVFVNGSYSDDHVAHMVSQSSALDAKALRDMLKGAQPRVLLVVNKSVPEWVDPIHRVGGLLSVVEVFRSGSNRHIFRVNGDFPVVQASDVATTCRLDPTIPLLLQIDSPVGLGVPTGARLSIRFRDGLTDWTRIDIASQVWLSPLGRNPLSLGVDYQIIAEERGRLSFRET